MNEINETPAPINDILAPIAGYLLTITRNTEGGWYELEIGIPANWVFKANNEIDCTVVSENENGKLIKISPKWEDILIDDLISFVNVIIETNKKIKDRELEFQKRMDEYKVTLEKEAAQYYSELDELKDKSFKILDGEIEAPVVEEPHKAERKVGRPRAKLPISIAAAPETTETPE